MRLPSFRIKLLQGIFIKSLYQCVVKFFLYKFLHDLCRIFFADKSIALALFNLPGNRPNGDVLEGCDIESAHITTAPKGFINSTLF